MNIQDRLIEILFSTLDRLLDGLTRGFWSKWHTAHLDKKWNG